MLTISHLTKTYGDKKAVDDLSLHIAPGEICGFIGHNGAGKTTTLKAVTGILPFDKGEITVCGTSIREDPLTCKRQLAYIPDNPDLYDFMTGIRYLNFIADIFCIPADVRAERIRRLGDSFDLTKDLAQPIAAYSHGMKQKLALCCALIHRPSVLLLDEPTTGVDAVSRSEFWDILSELKSKGISMLVSTPYMDEARRCDRIALCNEGKILGIDTPQGIVGRFDGPLYALSGRDMYGLLLAARRSSGVRECYPFGEAHHLIPADGFDAAAFARELAGQGFPDAVIRPAEAGIEDVFIKLMHHEP